MSTSKSERPLASTPSSLARFLRKKSMPTATPARKERMAVIMDWMRKLLRFKNVNRVAVCVIDRYSV